MGDDRVLHTRWWHIAALMVVVGLALPAAHTVSIAAAQTPRPEKLWDAYPLDPGEEGVEPADPAPTPTPAPVRRTGSPGRPVASEADGGGVLVLALIGGAAFVVGLSAGEVVRRRRRRAIAAQAEWSKVAPAQPLPVPVDGAPEQEPPEAAEEPLPVPRPEGRDPVGWIAPAPPPAVPPSSPWRFAPRGGGLRRPRARGRARSTGSPATSSPGSAPWRRRPVSCDARRSGSPGRSGGC